MNLGSDFSDDRGFPNWFIAPSLSAFYKLVGPRRVAMAMALILMFQNLVGLGLGPFVTGATIDWAAQHLFAAQHAGGFAALCPGGVDAPDAPGLHTVCRVTLARATEAVFGCSQCSPRDAVAGGV